MMMVDRERLTLLLRGLAADLDEVDRRLSELEWRERGAGWAAQTGERADLVTRRTRLDARLRVLALQLNELDCAMSTLKGHHHGRGARVGTCPHCGYPSLDSGLCAYCRP